MNSSNFAKLLAIASFSALGSSAHAALTLHLDPSAKTFWFSGTDSGNPSNSALPTLAWSNGGATTGLNSLTQLSPPESYITVAPPATYASFPVSTLSANDDGFVILSLHFSTTAGASLTGTGSAQVLSYASWSTAAQNALEGEIGSSLALSTGSGAGSLAVVPEPSALALCGLGVLVLFGRRRA
jgi:hypothetical protein